MERKDSHLNEKLGKEKTSKKKITYIFLTPYPKLNSSGYYKLITKLEQEEKALATWEKDLNEWKKAQEKWKTEIQDLKKKNPGINSKEIEKEHPKPIFQGKSTLKPKVTTIIDINGFKYENYIKKDKKRTHKNYEDHYDEMIGFEEQHKKNCEVFYNKSGIELETVSIFLDSIEHANEILSNLNMDDGPVVLFINSHGNKNELGFNIFGQDAKLLFQNLKKLGLKNPPPLIFLGACNTGLTESDKDKDVIVYELRQEMKKAKHVKVKVGGPSGYLNSKYKDPKTKKYITPAVLERDEDDEEFLKEGSNVTFVETPKNKQTTKKVESQYGFGTGVFETINEIAFTQSTPKITSTNANMKEQSTPSSPYVPPKEQTKKKPHDEAPHYASPTHASDIRENKRTAGPRLMFDSPSPVKPNLKSHDLVSNKAGEGKKEETSSDEENSPQIKANRTEVSPKKKEPNYFATTISRKVKTQKKTEEPLIYKYRKHKRSTTD